MYLVTYSQLGVAKYKSIIVLPGYIENTDHQYKAPKPHNNGVNQEEENFQPESVVLSEIKENTPSLAEDLRIGMDCRLRPITNVDRLLAELLEDTDVDAIRVSNVDESALFVLPLTLDEYAQAYPNRLNKSMLKNVTAAKITVAQFLCANFAELNKFSGLGAKTIVSIQEVMKSAHGLVPVPDTDYCELLYTCACYIDKLKNSYKSHYDTYKRIKGIEFNHTDVPVVTGQAELASV